MVGWLVVYLLIDQDDVLVPFPVVAAEFVKDFSYILYLQLAMIGFLLFLLFLLFLFFYHPPSPGTLFSLVCTIAVSFDHLCIFLLKPFPPPRLISPTLANVLPPTNQPTSVGARPWTVPPPCSLCTHYDTFRCHFLKQPLHFLLRYVMPTQPPFSLARSPLHTIPARYAQFILLCFTKR